MWNISPTAHGLENWARSGASGQKSAAGAIAAGNFSRSASADTITIGHTPHVLLLALTSTQRKQAEVEILKTLRAKRNSASSK